MAKQSQISQVLELVTNINNKINEIADRLQFEREAMPASMDRAIAEKIEPSVAAVPLADIENAPVGAELSPEQVEALLQAETSGKSLSAKSPERAQAKDIFNNEGDEESAFL